MGRTASSRAALADGAWPVAGAGETPAACDALLADALRLTPLDYFVSWTGEELSGRPDSLMSHVVACMSEVATPVRLRELILRTWRERGERTDNPINVRDVVRQHQSATRVVLVLLQRRLSGEFVAVADIPYGVGSLRRVSRGDVVQQASLREARPGTAEPAARGAYMRCAAVAPRRRF